MVNLTNGLAVGLTRAILSHTNPPEFNSNQFPQAVQKLESEGMKVVAISQFEVGIKWNL
jgi:hypothetical protein